MTAYYPELNDMKKHFYLCPKESFRSIPLIILNLKTVVKYDFPTFSVVPLSVKNLSLPKEFITKVGINLSMNCERR